MEGQQDRWCKDMAPVGVMKEHRWEDGSQIYTTQHSEDYKRSKPVGRLHGEKNQVEHIMILNLSYLDFSYPQHFNFATLAIRYSHEPNIFLHLHVNEIL